MVDYFLDKENKSIRGGMINFVITLTYLILAVWAVFDPNVRGGVLSMSSFLSWFFVASFGIWQTKKIAEVLVSGKDNTVTVDQSTNTVVTPPSSSS
jgi:hypothetical protein